MAHTTTHRAALDARKSVVYSEHITEELRRYEEHLRDVRGLAEGSCRQRARIVGRLLHKKF
ncbi:MAG: integrase, partial [Gallionella sp.]